jgi:hypothetical protein
LHAIFGFNLSYQNRKVREAKLASGTAMCAAQILRLMSDSGHSRRFGVGR